MSRFAEVLREDRIRKVIFGTVAVLAACAFGTAVSYSATSAVAAILFLAVGVPLTLWFLRDLRVGLVIVILSIIPGNLVRLTLGTDVRGGSAVLLCDLVIPLLAVAWAGRKLVVDKELPVTPVHAPLMTFTFIAFVSLIQGAFIVSRLGTVDVKDFTIAFLYWARWVEYALLFFITLDVVRAARDVTLVLWTLLAGAVVIAIGGFYQLVYYPDFTEYAILYGWDPHQDRLLSSFFDPNFVGGFLALVLSVVIGLFYYTPELRKKVPWAIVGTILAAALVLTFSRSGYLALLAAGVVIGILRSRVSLFFGLVAIVITLVAVPRALTRITEGLSVDETGLKRVESWTKALSIVPAYPVLGVGYNFLATVQDRLGTADEFDVNNKSGVENSFLTVIVTTGLVGFASFAYLYFAILRSLYRNWKNKALADRWRGLNLGVFAGIIGLILHSMFLHSLMYPFILVYFWVLVAIALKAGKMHVEQAHKPSPVV